MRDTLASHCILLTSWNVKRRKTFQNRARSIDFQIAFSIIHRRGSRRIRCLAHPMKGLFSLKIQYPLFQFKIRFRGNTYRVDQYSFYVIDTCFVSESRWKFIRWKISLVSFARKVITSSERVCIWYSGENGIINSKRMRHVDFFPRIRGFRFVSLVFFAANPPNLISEGWRDSRPQIAWLLPVAARFPIPADLLTRKPSKNVRDERLIAVEADRVS